MPCQTESMASTNRTITLGGREVSRIGLGTNRLTNIAEDREFLGAAVAEGLRMIDTAHLYTSGESEKAIGEALAPFAAGVVVATKGGYNDPSPDKLRAEIEQSLVSLRRDSIELYYLHRPHSDEEFEAALDVLAEEHRAGRIERIGLSAVSVGQIERARQVVPIAAVQNEYHLGERRHEPEIDHCERNGIAFVPYYPLRRNDDSAVERIADEHGATLHAVIIAWLLQRSPAMLPIPGTRDIAHFKANRAAFALELSEAEISALNRS